MQFNNFENVIAVLNTIKNHERTQTDKLIDENNKLSKDLDRTRSLLLEVITNYSELKTNHIILNDTVTELRSDYTISITENNELKKDVTKYAQLKVDFDYSDLKSKYDKLESDYTILKNDHIQLTASIVTLKTELENLKQENGKLKHYKTYLSALPSKYESLIIKYNTIKKELTQKEESLCKIKATCNNLIIILKTTILC